MGYIISGVDYNSVLAGTDDLFEAIRSKQQKRMHSLVDSLEEKYCGGEGKKENKKQKKK